MYSNHFARGMFWGTILSIPLWMSAIGWIKIFFWVCSRIVFS